MKVFEATLTIVYFTNEFNTSNTLVYFKTKKKYDIFMKMQINIFFSNIYIQ